MYQPVAIEESVPEIAGRPRASWLGVLSRLGSAIAGNRKAMVGVLLLLMFIAMALLAPWVAPYDPAAQQFVPMDAPSHAHLLGTTSYGQDVMSQIIWGARQSLSVGILAAILSTIVSVLIGVTAAYRGGFTDHILSLITDIFLVVPPLVLAVVIAAYAKGGGAWMLIIVIAVTSWAYGARQFRSQGQSLRNREFLEVARVRGESSGFIILFEILPTMIPLIAASFLGTAVYAVLTAAGLQFIGLGNPDDISWGTMLYWAENNEALMAGSPYWALAPGVCIALLGAAFALLNYAFDEIGNPALRATRRKRGRRVSGS